MRVRLRAVLLSFVFLFALSACSSGRKAADTNAEQVLKTTGKAIDAGYKSASQEIKKGYNAIKKDYEETEIKER